MKKNYTNNSYEVIYIANSYANAGLALFHAEMFISKMRKID